MKRTLLFLCLIISCLLSEAQNTHNAFISISGTLGRHTIVFKDFDKSSGFSFGYNVNLGIYAVNKPRYNGGLVFTLLEGASRDTDRRSLSEEFVLPHSKFDKHEIFNFAQFRSANIGWFNEYEFSDNLGGYHQIGFGIFGTTERDQLLDFGMSNQLGVLIGESSKFRVKLGLNHDNTFGTGNPNYLQNNWGIIFGGYRCF